MILYRRALQLVRALAGSGVDNPVRASRPPSERLPTCRQMDSHAKLSALQASRTPPMTATRGSADPVRVVAVLFSQNDALSLSEKGALAVPCEHNRFGRGLPGVN